MASPLFTSKASSKARCVERQRSQPASGRANIAPERSFLTNSAVDQFGRFQERLCSLPILAAADEIEKIAPLISHHPRLQEVCLLLNQIIQARRLLVFLTWQGEGWDCQRRRAGEFDDRHEDAAYRLSRGFLEPIWALPLIQFSNELEGIADLIEHHPSLRREIRAMREIVAAVTRLEELDLTCDDCGPVPTVERAGEQGRGR